MKTKLLALFFILTIALLAPTKSQAAYETYVNTLPTPNQNLSSVGDVQNELERVVSEMVTAGHMAPTLYFIGLGGYPAVFYVTPGETIYTLSVAYPYLSSSLRTQIKSYIDRELGDYPPHSVAFYPPLAGARVGDQAGARREPFPINPNQTFNFWPLPGIQPFTLYAIWAYSYYTNDWAYATSNYSSIRNIYTALRDAGTPQTYADVAGLIGFARIAQHLGNTADYNEALALSETALTQATNFAQFRANAESRFPQRTTYAQHGFTTPIFMSLRNPVAVHFNRDLGRFLKDNAAAAAQSYADYVEAEVPLWWINDVGSAHGESAYATPEYGWTNFMLKSYVLSSSIDQLKSYLDMPTRKGDLLYMQKLVAVLDTATGSSSPTPTPTPSPQCRADVNGNGTVEIGDISGILFYWGQSCAANMSACIADVNGNGNIEVGDIAGVLFYWGGACNQ